MMFCIDRNQPSISFIALAEHLLAVVGVTTMRRTFLINYLRMWAASNKWHYMKFRFISFFLHYHIIHVEFIGRSNTIHLLCSMCIPSSRFSSLHESVSIRQVVKSVRIADIEKWKWHWIDRSKARAENKYSERGKKKKRNKSVVWQGLSVMSTCLFFALALATNLTVRSDAIVLPQFFSVMALRDFVSSSALTQYQSAKSI